MSYRCIMFDCMNTVVDIKEDPDLRLYAYWAYHGSTCEKDWSGFDQFHQDYILAKTTLDQDHPDYQEYDFYERLRHMIENRFKEHSVSDKDLYYEKLIKNYWQNYKDNCYVKEEVKTFLGQLQGKYRLGVVSNFMIKEGVEELLEINGIDRYFDFVVSSIDVGWRKPSELIFKKALQKADTAANQVLFVGDDLECDFRGPQKLGIKTVLLDKKNQYPEIKPKIKKLNELGRFLNDN